MLGQLRLALGAVRRSEPPPKLAVVLLGPMLWSRYEDRGDDVRLQVHVDGPARGDVVVVTEASAIEALALGRLSTPEAVALGIIRLYGRVADSKRALEWMSAISQARPDVR